MNVNGPYEDESLLLLCFREGDGNAFKAIYDAYYRPLFHFANRYVKDTEQAEDLVAESFIVVWQKREEFQTLKGLTAFLYTIVRNASLNFLAKLRRQTASTNELTYLSANSQLENQLDAVRSDLIQYSLIEGANLPAEMKKVFRLLYIEGFSATEAADKLNLSVDTVRVQKRNAVRRVRDTLSKKGLLGWLF